MSEERETNSPASMCDSQARELIEHAITMILSEPTTTDGWITKEDAVQHVRHALASLPQEPASQPHDEYVAYLLDMIESMSKTNGKLVQHIGKLDQRIGELEGGEPEPASQEATFLAFEAWWLRHGQFCRAGGGEYEKTFAWRAWEASAQIPCNCEAPPAASVKQSLTVEQIDTALGDHDAALNNEQRAAVHAAIRALTAPEGEQL